MKRYAIAVTFKIGVKSYLCTFDIEAENEGLAKDRAFAEIVHQYQRTPKYCQYAVLEL